MQKPEVVACLTSLIVCLLLVQTGLMSAWWHYYYYYYGNNMDEESSASSKQPQAFSNVTTGYIIALDPLLPHIHSLQKAARHWLGIDNMQVQQAINASEALRLTHDELPLYTRMTLSAGRHDHMQLGSGAMIGCLLSHMTIWCVSMYVYVCVLLVILMCLLFSKGRRYSMAKQPLCWKRTHS